MYKHYGGQSNEDNMCKHYKDFLKWLPFDTLISIRLSDNYPWGAGLGMSRLAMSSRVNEVNMGKTSKKNHNFITGIDRSLPSSVIIKDKSL